MIFDFIYSVKLRLIKPNKTALIVIMTKNKKMSLTQSIPFNII